MINCDLICNSYCFEDIATRSRQLTHPRSRSFFSNFVVKLTEQNVESVSYFFIENCMILALAVFSQYTRVLDYDDNNDDRTDRQTTTQLQRSAKWTQKFWKRLPISARDSHETTALQCESKTCHSRLRHNFGKCWPIFKISSLLDSSSNLP